MSSFLHFAEKSLIHGAVSAAATTIVGGYKARVIIPYLNTECPLYCIGALAGIATSLANDAMHTYIMPEIPINKKVRSEAATVLGIAMSGLIFVGSLYAVNPALPEEFGFLNSVGVGALAEVVSGYTLDMIR